MRTRHRWSAAIVASVTALTLAVTPVHAGRVPAVVPPSGSLVPAVVSIAGSFGPNGTDLPRPASVAKALRTPLSARSLGTRTGVVVLDSESGTVVHSVAASSTYIPASITKLFTGAVAVQVLGADTRYRVVRTGSRKRLVADPQGASLASLVEFAVRFSDNALSQALADESVRVSGRPWPTLSRSVLAARGLDVSSLALYDGSGLSRRNRMSATLPVALLQSIVTGGTTDPWWPVLTGLPVAGWDGTLRLRFTGPAAPARGLVRGKTGTLTGVTSLAGTVTTASGDLLVYAVMADRVPRDYGTRQVSKAAIDRVTAALVACGCR
jgi:serine-type D-Ala-D-Ala carboxypeptidase/endopeptidase (penicillin-binding protein 4)